MAPKLLIANRGEIACRVIRTARRLGWATVAVYSDADAGARHVRLADEAVRLGPAAARESYLDAGKVLAAAQATGATFIHPGYGFLSENAAFAEACAAAGVTFVGPPPAAIRAMGGKSAAKALMVQAKVPVVPGYHGADQSPDLLQAEADRIGYPVLIKASAGGGGKGMRIVRAAGEFAAALASCRREAAASFGDDTVLIEKYLERPRHIEVQVFADTQGHCLYLHERDCSVQRRHQKVLEEAPAPGMTPERRAAMGQAAVNAALAVGYVGAGTVEFIAAQTGEFYFMEMNTRLQVEHPVTEMITGLDLVEWQLRVASGEALPITQAEVPLQGHAIEARLYAEDPDRGFLPSTGQLVHLAFPGGEGVRIDTGVEAGDAISPHYDPMIAKLIVHGATRGEALSRLHRALGDTHIVGVENNVAFLRRLVAGEAFSTARLDTGLIEREHDALFPPAAAPSPAAWQAVAAVEVARQAQATRLAAAASGDPTSPWAATDGWRVTGVMPRVVTLRHGAETQAVAVTARAEATRAEPAGGADSWRLRLPDRATTVTVVARDAQRHLWLDGEHWLFTVDDPLQRDADAAAGAGGLRAPMPGKVIAWLVEPGAVVKAGTGLIVMEAMKMEHTLTAPADGTVAAFSYGVGEQVPEGAALVEFTATVSN